MLEAILIKYLVSAIFDAVADKANDLTGDQMKDFIREQIGDNPDAKNLLNEIVDEIGKRL
tara:strand:+ start:4562 stop:4741 length:180 start_codon:yes stop_codon:yes gene_type:complete